MGEKREVELLVVSTEMDECVRGQANQSNLPPGVVSQPLDGRVTTWATTWSEVIDLCEPRLKFVRELDYRSTQDAGVEYLRAKHEQYLPKTPRLEVISGGEGRPERARIKRMLTPHGSRVAAIFRRAPSGRRGSGRSLPNYRSSGSFRSRPLRS